MLQVPRPHGRHDPEPDRPAEELRPRDVHRLDGARGIELDGRLRRSSSACAAVTT
ncbi:MAG: hypothetical protein ACLR8Y_08945 [Alistipes indistinctus]